MMGRPPIGKKAMTAAERQRRRRKRRSRRTRSVAAKLKRARQQARAEPAVLPALPGVSYWVLSKMILESGQVREIWHPLTLLLAACSPMLSDTDLVALIGAPAKPPEP